MFGAVHLPCPQPAVLQMASVHCAPCHPLVQSHLFGETQVPPFEHPPLQTGTLHFEPEKPGRHVSHEVDASNPGLQSHASFE